MTELRAIAMAGNEAEAEIVCGILRSAGITCMHRITNLGFGSGGEMPSSGGGVREVLVRPEQGDEARELLAAVRKDNE